MTPRMVRASTDPGGVDYYLNGGGFIRESISRTSGVWNRSIAIASGTMYIVAIVLYAGDVVTKVGFLSGSTAAVAPTAWWFALYDSAATPALIAQSADQGSTAWGADTVKELSLTTPQTISATGLYYIGYSMTAGTPASISGVDANATASMGVVATGSKRLTGGSGSALGGTAPASLSVITTSRHLAYGWVL